MQSKELEKGWYIVSARAPHQIVSGPFGCGGCARKTLETGLWVDGVLYSVNDCAVLQVTVENFAWGE